MHSKSRNRRRVTNPARSLARRDQARRPPGSVAAARSDRGLRRPAKNRNLFEAKTVRLEDRGHQRSRAKAHQCRWPAGWAHSGRNRHPRWRHGCDGGKRNARCRARIRLSHGGGFAAAGTALRRMGGAGRGRHAASGDRDSDSRFADFASAGEEQIIADNACAHLFVLGASTTADWRGLDLVEEKPVITMRGKQFVGHGGNVLGDPRIALTWLANELRQLGVTLRAGEVVTTGTCHPPLPIQPGDVCAADFGLLGRVSVTFA